MSGYFDALNRRRHGSPPPVTVEAAPAPKPTEERRLVPIPAYEAPRSAPPLPAPYQALRESLLVAANGRPLKSIVFAGCRGGEGCSEVARNLAQMLAGSGLDVLLIDADRPSPGMAPDTGAGVDLAELVRTGEAPEATPTGGGRLAVVPRRASGSDKEHLYRGAEFAAWMADQRDRHDYVLVDAPPLLSSADALLMGRNVDGVVIVAESEATERESLVRASDQLRRAGVKVIGVVLNRTRNPVPPFLRPYVPFT